MVSNKIKFLYMHAYWNSTKRQLEHMLIEINKISVSAEYIKIPYGTLEHSCSKRLYQLTVYRPIFDVDLY